MINSSPFIYFEQPRSGGDFRWYIKNDEFDEAMYIEADEILIKEPILKLLT